MRASPPLRVGIVDYLNSWPLAWDFLRGAAPEGLEASFHPPSRVADLLRLGELEVGLIPSVELQRIPGLRVLPELCVASQRQVRSVLLVSRKPIEQVESVALDLNSRTSAALVQIIFQDRYGIRPRVAAAEPEVEGMLEAHDAALLIGDPALRVDHHRYRVLDLAHEWWQLTGLPFVFAVWAVRADAELEGLTEPFRLSLEGGLASLPELARRAAKELGIASEEAERYLSRNLGYRLGHRELAGMGEFFSRAGRLGLLGELRPIPFVGGGLAFEPADSVE